MKNRPRQSKTNEKAHLIGVGLSNILINYVLADAIQPTKLAANGDNSISNASNVAGVT